MTGQVPESEGLLPRAEFYLLLSAVLNPGNTNRNGDQLREELLPDLTELSDAVSALTASWLNGFRESLAQLESVDQPLKEYSRLFLIPPAPCPLNLGYHLDGSLMGRTATVLDACYHRYGLERGESFHDLPDHLALNLQWLAWVMALANEGSSGEDADENPLADAAGVIADYTLPAVEQLCRRLDEQARERGLSALWPELLNVVRSQLQEDRNWLATHLGSAKPDPAIASDTAAETTEFDAIDLCCQSCGVSFVAEEALAMMISRLREAGLSTAHLERCPDCSSSQNAGILAMTPPGAKRFG
jgi:TorA maturation chaperone TorD